MLSTLSAAPDRRTLFAVQPPARISVFLADDNLIVREGVRALIESAGDLEVVGVAADLPGLVDGAGRCAPRVIVTDVRMPPSFGDEGIVGALAVRKRHPGTGIVVLSQYDDPDYAIRLLAEGAAGCAYLLKDRVADGDQLVRAVRAVATGGSVLEPRIVDMLVAPVTERGNLSQDEERLLQLVAEGRPIKVIALRLRTTPAAVSQAIDDLFLKMAQDASAGVKGSLHRLKSLHRAIVELEEQGETLSRLLPTGVAAMLRADGYERGRPERLVVTVLMSDVRGYSSIAELTDPSLLCGQLDEHRAAMNTAILGCGGTVMQFVGDAVMAVFGAPVPQLGHADSALAAAAAMHAAQLELNLRWESGGLPAFGLGIGLSTGDVAAALLGSDEHLEYSVVGDAVNLTQRLQQFAEPGQTVLSEATFTGLTRPCDATRLEPVLVKGRRAPVTAYLLG